MIQKSIKGFLWIPLTEDSLTSDGANQSNEASTGAVQLDANNDTPTGSGGNSNHSRDPPLRGRATKSKRQIRAANKRSRKKVTLARKCKNPKRKTKTVNSKHRSSPAGSKHIDMDTTCDEIQETAQGTNDLDNSFHSTIGESRSLSDMMASAYRDTPIQSNDHDTSSVASSTISDSSDNDHMTQIATESQLVASLIEAESASREVSRLKMVIELLEQEIDRFKKISATQKQEIKTLQITNDKLMRELSRFRGMRKYTKNQSSPETDGDKTNDLREKLDIASAKLDSFKSQVMTLASSMINLLEDEPHDSVDNRDSTGFAPVRPRRCRDIDTSGSQPHPTTTQQPSQGQPIPVIVRATPRAEVTSPKPYSQALASAPPPQTIAVPQELPQGHHVVIGTSLVRGVGARLAHQGIDAATYTYAGCEIPEIRSRIKHIATSNDNPCHVFLQCGGNDAENRPAERVIGQYDSLIQEVRRRCPNTTISVGRIPLRRNNNSLHNKIGQINSYLEQKCSHEPNLNFVDACPKSVYMYRRDLVHFNKRGSRVFADNIGKCFQGFPVHQTMTVMWLNCIRLNACLRASLRVTWRTAPRKLWTWPVLAHLVHIPWYCVKRLEIVPLTMLTYITSHGTLELGL